MLFRSMLQAVAAAQVLGTFDAVWSSTLQRAAYTAAIIAEHIGVGPVQTDPQGLLQRYRAHRLMREARVLAAIEAAPRDLSAVLADAYADTPEALWPLAARSLEAHLRKLVVEGRVRRQGALVARS